TSTAETGALYPFDLPTIFRCAVELGAATADETRGVANHETEIAGGRLMRVLNARDAKFPDNWDWEPYQAHQEGGIPWTNGPTPRPGWRQELDLANAEPEARRQLLTINLALADLLVDLRGRDRGRELLSAGTWNLWDGMGRTDRNAVRHL